MDRFFQAIEKSRSEITLLVVLGLDVVAILADLYQSQKVHPGGSVRSWFARVLAVMSFKGVTVGESLLRDRERFKLLVREAQ